MKDFLVLVLALSVLTQAQGAMASSELDSEINSFQVELKPAKSFKKSKVFQRQEQAAKKLARKEKAINFNKPVAKNTIVASAKQPMKTDTRNLEKEYAATQADNTEFDAVNYSRSTPKFKTHQRDQLFQRVTALPVMALSIYDGKDDNLIAPKGYSNSFNYGISGQAAVDMNIFSSDSIFLETGVAFIQMGSDTGYNISNSFLNNTQQQNTIISDQLYTSYLGLTLNAKWLASGERSNSFYAKAGGTPLFLMGKNYASQNLGFLTEARFGTISTFDMALDLGIGYSYKIGNDLHLVLDVTAYQGLIPVTSNYSVYNAALTTGIGVGYTL